MSNIVSVTVKQISPSASEAQARTHSVVCDRPESKGGSDAGAMGGEFVLMGLGGCFMSNLLAAVKARNSEVSDVSVSVAGTLDGTPPRFTKMSLTVEATYSDREDMEKLVVIAERGCIVANTLKGSVALDITVR